MEPIRLNNSDIDVQITETAIGNYLFLSYNGVDRVKLSAKAVYHLSQIIGNRLDVETVTTYNLNAEL